MELINPGAGWSSSILLSSPSGSRAHINRILVDHLINHLANDLPYRFQNIALPIAMQLVVLSHTKHSLALKQACNDCVE
jgi:hypothetical protein